MIFRTIVPIQPSDIKFTHQDKLMTLGSCFSEYIGNRLRDACFGVNINPFGVLFNPLSIKDSLEILLSGKNFTTENLFQHNDLWSSYAHSTRFSSINQESCLMQINNSLVQAREQLQDLNVLLITFGTAWIYALRKTGKVVANCHKMSPDNFIRRRLTVNEIVTIYRHVLNTLKLSNSNLQVIFTISPIRHWKDGPHENNLSKSILHLAVEEICEEMDFVQYFPAYEIQLDELRDYRFFATDMIHPSDNAIDYIWQQFENTYFSAETKKIIKKISAYIKKKKHHPIHPEKVEYQNFCAKLEDEKNMLIRDYPFLKDRI